MKSKVQPMSLASVLNALERSMKMKHNNVLTFNLKKRVDTDFLTKISRIIGELYLTKFNKNARI